MFLQKEAAGFLKENIEQSLTALSEAAGLYEMVREPLTKKRRGLAPGNDDHYLWPLLPLMVSDAVCGGYENVMPVAAAFQFIFAAGDVFDDIEDADAPDSLCAKYGPAAAISAATTLLILGERSLGKLKSTGIDSDLIVNAVNAVNSYYVTACIGQHLDLTTDRSHVTEETYLNITAAKAASQIECVCYTGALLAGADRKLIDIFARFGRNLGMVSQLTNDIQGILSGIDIKRVKMTLPVIFALTGGDSEIRNKLEVVYNNKQDIESGVVREWLFQSGAIHYATVKMEYYKQLAREALAMAEDAGAGVELLTLFSE